MPFVKRFVEPRCVSGKQLEVKVWDELEAVQVNTLANLIRQLGNVMGYAEEMMGEISETCTSFSVRLSSLRCRTKRLREEVLTELDAIEEVSNMEDLQILFPDGHFESEQIIEEQQMVLLPLPKTTQNYYRHQATPSPDLYQFTMLRDDGENAMHFFTNPNYFFEHWRTLMQQKAEEEARTEEEVRMAEISVQEEEKISTNLVRGGSFRGSHLSVRRAEVLQMLSEGDSKNGLFTLTRRRTVQPVRSNNEHGSQSSLHATSAKVHGTDLPKWGSSDGLQQRSNSMPWLRSSSVVRQGPPSKLQASVKATREGTPRKDSNREGTPRKGSTREGTPQKDITPDRTSSSNSPITPLSTATPTLTTSRSSLGSESQTKITSTTPIPVVPPVKPKPHQEVKKPSPAREVSSRPRNISPLVNGGGVEPYDEFDDSFTFQRSASVRAEKSSSAFSRSAKIRRSFSKKNSIKNGISRIYFGDSQIARAAMELAEEKKPDDQLKREPTPKEDSKSPPPSQSKMTYGQKKRRFASFKGKHQHHDNDYDVVDAELHRSATLPSRPKGSFSKNSMFHAAPPKALNHGEASSASIDEAAIQGKSAYSPPRGTYSSSQIENSTHSKFSNYARIEPLHVHNSSWESDGYGDSTHSTFGTLGRKPQRRRSPAGTTKMATPRMYSSSSPMRKNSATRLSPKISNGHIPNGHSDGVFDLTDPEHTITENEEKHSKFNNDENVEKKRQSELLDQIRVGIELKKERQKEELARRSSSNLPWNVSAILERRLVLRPSIEDDEIPDDWSEDL